MEYLLHAVVIGIITFLYFRTATFEAARRARAAGATVFAVGVAVTSYFDLQELRGIV